MLRSCWRPALVASTAVVLCVAIDFFAAGQVLDQEQEIEVRDLPSLVARSQDPSDVLVASLDTVFHDHNVCCGEDSALGESVQAADPKSLKDVATKIGGRHLLSDGRPIMVTAEYLAPDAVSSGYLVSMIKDQHALPMEYDSQVYVVRGVVYVWVQNGRPESPGPLLTVVRKFRLWDTRYSGSRRELVFNRQTDDWSKVQGFLFVQAKLQ